MGSEKMESQIKRNLRKYIEKELIEYCREKIHDEFIFDEKVIEIMIKNGDLDKEFKIYCNKEKLEKTEKDLSDTEIMRLIRKKIKEETQKEIIRDIFVELEHLNSSNEKNSEIIYLWFLEVFFQVNDDLKKYGKFLGKTMKKDLKVLMEFWEDIEMLKALEKMD